MLKACNFVKVNLNYKLNINYFNTYNLNQLNIHYFIKVFNSTLSDKKIKQTVNDEIKSDKWIIWRQDDHGNKFPMRFFNTEEDARNWFVSGIHLGHKQHYWLERDGKSYQLEPHFFEVPNPWDEKK